APNSRGGRGGGGARGGKRHARRQAEHFIAGALAALDELGGVPMQPYLRALARFILERKH
ncbi:MAG: hypothetical protein DIU69_02715, partial [Bacillota bacterium]